MNDKGFSMTEYGGGSVGVPGAAGAAGSPGAPGVKGDPGVPGAAGQPGATGQAGADGAVGRVGNVGIIGKAGPAGETGETGPAGERGEHGENMQALKVTDRRLLILFLGGLLIFGFLAFRSQTNENSISHNLHMQKAFNYAQCQRALTNTKKINATNQAFIDFLSGFLNNSREPGQLRHFIGIYQQSKLPVPTCGPTP